MGDMADWDIEQHEWDGEDYCFPRVQRVRCKFCKRHGFIWEQQDDASWRLVTFSGTLHHCGAWLIRDSRIANI